MFKWFKLWLTNLPAITKIILVVLGTVGGTVAVPEVYDKVVSLTSSDVPIPKGQITTTSVTDPGEVWRSQVNIALGSGKDAIDTNTADLETLRSEISELEARLKALSNRGDSRLEARVSVIETLVQP